jgi:hypothetical protein
MPPNSRESFASDEKRMTSRDSAGNWCASTVAAAPDVVEWPDGYEGKLGVTMIESQSRSIEALMVVTGRGTS